MFEAPQKHTLKKTSEEKAFLRSISALEAAAVEEKDPQLRKAYEAQLNGLKKGLSDVAEDQIGKNISSDSRSGFSIKTSASTFDKPYVGNLHPHSGHGLQTNLKPNPMAPIERISLEPRQSIEPSLLEKYYCLIIERHSEAINEKERKTVGEIKSLVDKEDLTVQSLAASFSMENYSFEKNFLQAAEKAFIYMRDEIATLHEIDIGVSFWLTSTEIVSNKFADDEDKAILLCSLLYSLGDNEAAVVIAELESGSPHAFVITEHSGKFILLDPSQKHSFRDFFGLKAEALKNYHFEGSQIRKFMYNFNNSKYEQF